MKKLLAIFSLVFIVGFGAILLAQTGSGGEAPAEAESSSMCPMGGMMGMPGMKAMMNGSQCMSSMSESAGDMSALCMEMMLDDDQTRSALVEVLKADPDLRDRLETVLDDSKH